MGSGGQQRGRDCGSHVRDLRLAEATRFDVTIKDGKVESYRVRLDLSFKYESGD